MGQAACIACRTRFFVHGSNSRNQSQATTTTQHYHQGTLCALSHWQHYVSPGRRANTTTTMRCRGPRQVSWLTHQLERPSSRCRRNRTTVTSWPPNPGLQWRVRTGFAPVSLFTSAQLLPAPEAPSRRACCDYSGADKTAPQKHPPLTTSKHRTTLTPVT